MRSSHPFPELELSFEEPPAVEAEAQPAHHPDYCEKGTEIALGFIPHRGENRRTRRTAVATWAPPEQDYKARNSSESRANPVQRDEAEGLHVPPPPDIPTRRELWLQRQKQRRGKLDPELRRLQRRKAATK
jgi:hypothetical protein